MAAQIRGRWGATIIPCKKACRIVFRAWALVVPPGENEGEGGGVLGLVKGRGRGGNLWSHGGQ